MTGAKINRNKNDLDIYFQSKLFLKRLDEIRDVINARYKNNDTYNYCLIFADRVVKQFDFMHGHIGIIANYLLTGIYNPDRKYLHQIYIQDNIAIKDPSIPFNTPISNVYYRPLTEIFDNKAVLLVLDEQTTQKKLINFVRDKNNWRQIKKTLDANYPDRRLEFHASKKFEKYIRIADKMNKVKDRHQKAKLANELSNQYKLDTTDIYTCSKKYDKSKLMEPI